MRIFNYDEAGFFTIENEAPESPREPGVYILPARATEHAPPKRKPGTLQRFGANGWELVPAEPEAVQEIAPPETLSVSESVGPAIADLDTAATRARLAYVGEPTKVLEYMATEAQARAYLAGTLADVPLSVLVWAEVEGIEPQEAAQSIIAAAERSSEALGLIRAARMRARAAVEEYAASEGADMEGLARVTIEGLNAITSAASPTRIAVDAENEEHRKADEVSNAAMLAEATRKYEENKEK